MNFRRYHEYPIHRDPGAISWVRKNGGESFQELACVAGVETGSGLWTEGTVIGQQKIFCAQSEASIYSATFVILYEAVYVHAGELSSRRVFSENEPPRFTLPVSFYPLVSLRIKIQQQIYNSHV